MTYPQQGMPGATGLPQMPMGQQALPPQQPTGGYGIESLPGPQGPQGQYPAFPGYAGAGPGVPGTPQAQPLQTAMPGQGWGQQPMQQGQQGMQQGMPPQPQQGQMSQPQQSRTAQLDDGTILDGPGVPPELRGRSWGDARRLYQALSTDWLTRNRQPTTPAQQTMQSVQQPQPPRYGPTPPSQPLPPQQGGQQGQQFWQDPQRSIQEAVSAAVEQRLAPIAQQSQAQAIMQARNIAQTGVQDFGYLEPYVMQIVGQADPELLTNPQTWVAAARMARGQLVEAGQYQPQQSQQRPQSQQVPVNQFFSEAPSAPSLAGYQGQAGVPQPTQTDYEYARRFQMPVDQYMSWKHGVASTQPLGSF
jgi:hypothetical protein